MTRSPTALEVCLEIWSYGHRNVQAATLHPETGQLWTVDVGARAAATS